MVGYCQPLLSRLHITFSCWQHFCWSYIDSNQQVLILFPSIIFLPGNDFLDSFLELCPLKLFIMTYTLFGVSFMDERISYIIKVPSTCRLASSTFLNKMWCRFLDVQKIIIWFMCGQTSEIMSYLKSWDTWKDYMYWFCGWQRIWQFTMRNFQRICIPSHKNIVIFSHLWIEPDVETADSA